MFASALKWKTYKKTRELAEFCGFAFPCRNRNPRCFASSLVWTRDLRGQAGCRLGNRWGYITENFMFLIRIWSCRPNNVSLGVPVARESIKLSVGDGIGPMSIICRRAAPARKHTLWDFGCLSKPPWRQSAKAPPMEKPTETAEVIDHMLVSSHVVLSVRLLLMVLFWDSRQINGLWPLAIAINDINRVIRYDIR